MALTKRKTPQEYQQILDRFVENFPRVCQRCGCEAKLIRDECLRLRCIWKNCRFRQSLFEGTVFGRKKIDRIMILEILDSWMAKCSNNAISWFLKCSYESVLGVLKMVRKLAVPRYYESVDRIGATDTIVEIDESKFGKRKYHKGHRVEGVWVLGMVERSERRRLILVVVDNRTKETLNSQIIAHVHKGSVIYADCWRGYMGVRDNAYEHRTVNHSKGFVDPADGTHTNTIEGCWFAVKAQVPIRNRTSSKIGLYLLRFMLLRNEEGDPLLNLLKYLV